MEKMAAVSCASMLKYWSTCETLPATPVDGKLLVQHKQLAGDTSTSLTYALQRVLW